METKNLQCFVEVCKCRSINEAADHCHMSRQGLSSVIARLEDEVGSPLLIRSNYGVEPTKAGNILFESSKKMLMTYDLCIKNIKSLKENDSLEMCIAPGVYRHIDTATRAFSAEYPDYRLKITELSDLECEKNVKSGAIKLGLTPGPIDDAELEHTQFYSSPYVLIVNKNHELAALEIVSVTDIEGYTVMVQGPDRKIGTHFENTCKKSGVNVDIAFVYDHIMQFYLVETNVYIGVTALKFFEQIVTKSIKPIPFDDENLAWMLNFITRKGSILSKPARDFKKILFSTMTTPNTTW